jgi:hypothetical protein
VTANTSVVSPNAYPALNAVMLASRISGLDANLADRKSSVPVVAHHHSIGELAAQRLDLEAISEGLKVGRRFPPLSVFGLCDWPAAGSWPNVRRRQ